MRRWFIEREQHESAFKEDSEREGNANQFGNANTLVKTMPLLYGNTNVNVNTNFELGSFSSANYP